MLLGVVHSTQQFRYIPADQIGVGDVTSVFVRVTLVISYFLIAIVSLVVGCFPRGILREGFPGFRYKDGNLIAQFLEAPLIDLVRSC